MRAVPGILSAFVLRPAVAIVACALVAVAVDDASRTVIQVSLLTPTAIALALIAMDGNRQSFAASGYAGAAGFGFTVAALDAADTVTGYDLGFIIEWAVISAISAVPVYGISFVWAATGTIASGIDELVEARHDAQRARGESDDVDSSGPGASDLVTTPPIVPVPSGPATGAHVAPTSVPAPERPANFDAEELVASLEAYQVNGLPWWKSGEANVMVQYRDRAQMEIEGRIVPFYGWRPETSSPTRPAARMERRRGMFNFQFSMGTKLPDDELTVLWVRDGPGLHDTRAANEAAGA